MLDIADQCDDWMTEEKSISEHPFLPLTGDMGEEVVRFEGPPVRELSNFSIDPDNPKYEWRFTVIHMDHGEPIRKLITESSQNFLAQVTKVTQKGTIWNKLIGIKWEKKKANRSGRWFKNFEMVELVDPQE